MSTLTTRPPPWPAYSTNESSPPSTTKCFVLGPLQVPVPLLKSKQIQLEYLPLSLSLSLSNTLFFHSKSAKTIATLLSKMTLTVFSHIQPKMVH